MSRGFLSSSNELKPPSAFSLEKVAEHQPRHGEDLHQALDAGLVVLEEVIADGFGLDNLRITLRRPLFETSKSFSQVGVQRAADHLREARHHLPAEVMDTPRRSGAGCGLHDPHTAGGPHQQGDVPRADSFVWREAKDGPVLHQLMPSSM